MNNPEQDVAREENRAPVSGLGQLGRNIRSLPKNFVESLMRQGLPNSSRGRSKTVFGNVFLHVHSTRTHRWSCRPLFTMGLGVALLAVFIALAVSGVILMIYFEPSVDGAYNSIKDIQTVVPGGRYIRNLHRWGAYLMVALVFLHMARVFFTNSSTGPRQLNWVVGVILLVLTLAFAFTGYCLPWDQLAYWAITIGSNIAGSPAEITDALGITDVFDVGGMQRDLMLGSKSVGGPALLRFYWGHCIVLPIITLIFIVVHIWRIRKDGGLSRPTDIREEELAGTPSDELAETAFRQTHDKTYGLMCVVPDKTPAVDRGPEQTVSTWPSVFYREMAVMSLVILALVLLSLFFNAPLKEMANPAVPENPAKAPWYFLALQEIISYSAFAGGILLPTLSVLFLMLVPYLDREEGQSGRWFESRGLRKTALRSAILATVAVVAMLAVNVKIGWLQLSQIWITFVNPGTVLAGIFVFLSLGVTARTRSTRHGVTVLFVYFLVSFVILTYFASVHRGPNWDFYWWPSLWPTH